MWSRGRGRRSPGNETPPNNNNSLGHGLDPDPNFNNLPKIEHPEVFPGANLRKAHLEGAELWGRDIRGAHLEEAHLEGAILEGAQLQGAYLEGAHLEMAKLFGAQLQDAHLQGAHLEGADLTAANLLGADLTGVDLTKVKLSKEQEDQIQYPILRRMSEQQLVRQPIQHQSMQQQMVRPSIEHMQQQMQKFQNRYIKTIIIPRELLTPPNFGLFDFIMQQDLSENFRFEFEGRNRNATDLTELAKIVFDRILPVYVNKLFEKSGDFILLKEDLGLPMLSHCTNQLIILAKAADAQIKLKINPLVVELLSKSDLKESIATRQNFNKLYANFKEQINLSGNNDSNYLLNNKLKPEINAAGNLNLLSKDLKAEILFRKTLSDLGFESWKQYDIMKLFINSFWNISKKNKVNVTKNGRQVKLDLFVTDQ